MIIDIEEPKNDSYGICDCMNCGARFPIKAKDGILVCPICQGKGRGNFATGQWMVDQDSIIIVE